jgi:hypothetical protein
MMWSDHKTAVERMGPFQQISATRNSYFFLPFSKQLSIAYIRACRQNQGEIEGNRPANAFFSKGSV